MSVERIVGRREEKSILDKVAGSSDPEFVAVYGRRRIGKTFLIREYFEHDICFEMVGIHGATLADQLENFAHELDKALGLGVRPQRPRSWIEAFQQLESFLESAIVKSRVGKRVVFIDELPWLNTPRSKFLASLDHFWNRWGSKQRDFVLVVCGSAASWMLQHIVHAKGGLHNRLTRRIRLLPFSLQDASLLLQKRGVNLTPIQTTELYLVMGGVPYYLNQADPGLSASQIIDKTCFSSNGFLRQEFDALLASLFGESAQHQTIVRLLARKRDGLTRSEIAAFTKLKSGGSFTKRLEELEASGFISAHVPFGKKTNDALYRLSDEYCIFYFDWLDKLGRSSFKDGYWMSLQNTPRRTAWAGYAFERLCIRHISELKAALGIAGVATTEAPWRYVSSGEFETSGAQIDLLIDRKDYTINICEMKFYDSKFTIDKKYAEALRRKIGVFKQATGTRKNVFLTMVTPFGITDNAYAKELVASSITLSDLMRL